MPPEPTFSFTIPSLNDDALLECRVYTPPTSRIFKTSSDHRVGAGAVIAHPYASFGGCYDDHVVLDLVEEVLLRGIIVGTFNFRYRHGSLKV